MDGAAPGASADPDGKAPAVSDADARRAELYRAFAAARDLGDAETMAEVALALPASQGFGVFPGQIPVLLHEAYAATDSVPTRCRLAAALARSWVYGGDAAHATTWAAEAERLADEVGSPAAVADALDAGLLAHWGPDDFATRLVLAARLDEVAARVNDADVRLGAHLWRLTTAWECLDVVAVQRQLRALDVLAAESQSRRADFFATSRRAMYALVTDDAAAAARLIDRTAELGAELSEPDVAAVLHELRGAEARATGDRIGLCDEALAHEEFGTAQGIPSITAVGASLWLAAGQPDRAARLADQIAAGGIDRLPRDVDFLLVVACVVEVAAHLGMTDLARVGGDALAPYAGRAVLNAGAVTFHGVVDDYVHRARRTTGDPTAGSWLDAARGAYRRIGAAAWERELGAAPRAPAAAARVPTLLLVPRPDGRWSLGSTEDPFSLPDRKGLHYLRHLVEHPGVDIEALVLSDAAAHHPGAGVREDDMGEALDATARSAYRARLERVGAELDAADARGDAAAGASLAAERDAIVAELRGATGLGGRRRRPGGSSERARVAVRKAIAAALVGIDAHDPSLARRLRTSVRTGTSCRYEPDPDHPVVWRTRTSTERAGDGDDPRPRGDDAGQAAR
jgi:hypothetical protein